MFIILALVFYPAGYLFKNKDYVFHFFNFPLCLKYFSDTEHSTARARNAVLRQSHVAMHEPSGMTLLRKEEVVLQRHLLDTHLYILPKRSWNVMALQVLAREPKKGLIYLPDSRPGSECYH